MNCLITITGISETGDADSVETKSIGMVHSVKTEAGSALVPGEDHDCLYETSAGVLAFTVRGKASAVWEENGKVSARLSYSLLSGQDILSNNEILITAEPLG